MSEKIYGQIDLETIEKLADIVTARELSEITIEDGDRKISIKGRKCPPPPPGGPGLMPPPQMSAAPAPAAPAVSESVTDTVKTINAPIIGTFYAAPSPDSQPYVSVGDIVHKGDTVFIIESMKVMSEVQSEEDGVVKTICVKDGDPVEYGQPVIILE